MMVNGPRIVEMRQPKLSAQASSRIDDYERGAELFKKENPNMDFSVIDRFIAGYREIEHVNSQAVAKHNANNRKISAAHIGKLDERELQYENAKRRHDYIGLFNKSVSPDEKEVWQKYARKMQPPSLIGAATKQFFDSDKGLSIPGLIGGALGGYFIFNQMGGMSNAWMAVGAGLLAAIAGAWLTNQAAGKIGNLFHGEKKDPAAKIDGPEKQRGLAQGAQAPARAATQGLDADDHKKMQQLVGKVAHGRLAVSDDDDFEKGQHLPNAQRSRVKTIHDRK